MRLLRPWMVVALLGLLAVGALEVAAGTGLGGFAAGALGALLGVIALPIATQLGLLLGAAVFGLRIRHVVIGSLRGVRTWQLGRTAVTLRALPVTLASEIGPWRGPVVLRCWLAGVCSALAGIGLVGVSWAVGGGSFWRGWVLAVTPLMLHKLWPRRAALTTSTGWLLFGLPRMSGDDRDEFRAGAVASRAHELLRTGQVEAAQQAVDRLAATHPALNTTVNCRITMHEARGDFAEAALFLITHISAAELGPREMSYALAGLAGVGCSAVEAGQLPAEEMLPVAKKALDDAVRLGFPAYQLSGTKALLALLEDGDPEEAARLAALGADHATSPMSKADDYATLARAQMLLRDNAGARASLDKAEAQAAWWPRVRQVRERLSVAG